MSRNRFIEDLAAGDRVQDFFMVVRKNVSTTRDGKPYLDLVLQDKTGRIDGKVWDRALEESEKFSSGDIIKILGTVTDFKGKMQIKVERLRKALEEDGVPEEDIHPSSEYDLDEMFGRLLAYGDAISDPHLKTLLDRLFDDDSFAAAFKDSPAAKSIHHTYVGGLLEHTLSILDICSFLAGHYGDLNKDLLITGAILHDIGKIEEIDNFDYTVEGELLGHISIGAMKIDGIISTIEGFPEDLRSELLHLILSHQGEKEWGSPVVPKTKEAIVLHHADNLDAKYKICKDAIEESLGQEGNFTGWIHSMARTFFKGGRE